MNRYRIEINVTSTEWSTCECYVEAESEKEAREKFEVDPDEYQWDNWEIQDSEIRGWDVWGVEQDEQMTKSLEEKPKKIHNLTDIVNEVMADMHGLKDKEEPNILDRLMNDIAPNRHEEVTDEASDTHQPTCDTEEQ
jgi:hypothetical protein